MLFLKQTHLLSVLGVLILLGLAFFAFAKFNDAKIVGETAQVVRGDVSVLVSVAGSIKTKNSAALSFPKTGVIEHILVQEGDAVKKGQVLASLGQAALISEYQGALARLALAKAQRDEERVDTGTEVSSAIAEQSRIKREQDEIVENARRTLLSTDLEARPEDKENNAEAPRITGTYTCTDQGAYTLKMYRSNAESGYSYTLSGLGEGTHTAYTGTAAALGDCGLSILFTENVSYGNEIWSVAVPNVLGTRYTANLNAYELAKEQRAVAIDAATEAIETAQQGSTGVTKSVLTEAGLRAEAEIHEAEAQVAIAEAKIADDTIRAPFDGIVSAIDIALGEVSKAGDGITMTANDTYELKIRVPEIDITHIEVGDPARASFDARPEEVVGAKVAFVSLLPTEIDGVAYYEAMLTLDTTPSWMRTGLNADVDVVIDRTEDVLILPKRFVANTNGKTQVYIHTDGMKTPLDVTQGLVGNDGYMEIIGLAEGTEVITP